MGNCFSSCSSCRLLDISRKRAVEARAIASRSQDQLVEGRIVVLMALDSEEDAALEEDPPEEEPPDEDPPEEEEDPPDEEEDPPEWEDPPEEE